MNVLKRLFAKSVEPKPYEAKLKRRSRIKGQREEFLEKGREMPDSIKLARIPRDND